MDLHYSQTLTRVTEHSISLNPLWIYTTLKHPSTILSFHTSLNPLWIYTTLKLCANDIYSFRSLNPLWIYTTLKQTYELYEYQKV